MTTKEATVAIVHPDFTADILPFNTFGRQFFDDHPSYKRYVDRDCKCLKSAENTCRFEMCGSVGETTLGEGGIHLAKWRSRCPERIVTDESIDSGTFIDTTFQEKWTTVYILTSNSKDEGTQYEDVRYAMEGIRLRTLLLDIPSQYWTWRFWFEMKLRYCASWIGIRW